MPSKAFKALKSAFQECLSQKCIKVKIFSKFHGLIIDWQNLKKRRVAEKHISLLVHMVH